jgi:hypothetical protein
MRIRAFAARAGLVTVTGATALGGLFEAMEIEVLSDHPPSYAAILTAENRTAAAYTAALAGVVLCAITFIVWLHRARKNTVAFGTGEHRYGPGWAIGGWFIPILNLWRPKQVVDDVWRASDPELPARPEPGAWLRLARSPLIGWWWGLYLAAAFTTRYSVIKYNAATTVPEFKSALVISLVSSGLTVAAGVLGIRLVSQLTSRQRLRAETIAALPDAPAPHAFAPPPAGPPRAPTAPPAPAVDG